MHGMGVNSLVTHKVGQLKGRYHQGIVPLGNVHRVSQVVSVAVGDQNGVHLDLLRFDLGHGIASKERINDDSTLISLHHGTSMA